jgi:hypothetical protein
MSRGRRTIYKTMHKYRRVRCHLMAPNPVFSRAEGNGIRLNREPRSESRRALLTT